MKKTSRFYTPALVLAMLGVQGCAPSGNARAGASPAVTTRPASAAPATGAAFPTNGEDKVAVRADTRQRFEAVAAAVRQEMSPGGRFEFVSGLERDTVDHRLADMQALFDRFGTVDEMDADSKVRLFNDQEKINGILTRNDSNREVCIREMPMGTHFPKIVCQTYGELRRQQEGNSDYLHRGNLAPPKLPLGELPPGASH